MKWQFSMNSYNVICMKTNDYYKNNKHDGPHINLIISGRLYEKVKKRLYKFAKTKNCCSETFFSVRGE